MIENMGKQIKSIQFKDPIKIHLIAIIKILMSCSLLLKVKSESKVKIQDNLIKIIKYNKIVRIKINKKGFKYTNHLSMQWDKV